MAARPTDVRLELTETNTSQGSHMSHMSQESQISQGSATPDPQHEIKNLREEIERLRQKLQQQEMESVERKNKEKIIISQINSLKGQCNEASVLIKTWKQTTTRLLIDCAQDKAQPDNWKNFVYIASATKKILDPGQAGFIALTHNAPPQRFQQLQQLDLADLGIDLSLTDEIDRKSVAEKLELETHQQLLEKELARLRGLEQESYFFIERCKTSIETFLEACTKDNDWDCFIAVAKAYFKLLPNGTAMFVAISGTAPVEVLQQLDANGLCDLSLIDGQGRTPLMRLACVTDFRRYDKLVPVYDWMINKHPNNKFFNKAWSRVDQPEEGPTAFDMACTNQNWILIYQMCKTPEAVAPYTFLSDTTQFQVRIYQLEKQLKITEAETTQKYSVLEESVQMIIKNGQMIPLAEWKAHKAQKLRDATTVLKWYRNYTGPFLTPGPSSSPAFVGFSSSSTSLSSSVSTSSVPVVASSPSSLSLDDDHVHQSAMALQAYSAAELTLEDRAQKSKDKGKKPK